MSPTILTPILLTLHVLVCLLMVFVILMQRTKQEGLGAAFGGGFTDSVFGAQTSTVLTKATVWLAAMFFILSISLGYLYSHRKQKSVINIQELGSTPPPATAPATPGQNPAAAPAPVSPVVPAPAVPVPEKK